MRFHVETMTCGGCVKSVTRAIHAVDASARINADPDSRTLEVETGTPRERIATALEQAGFPVRPAA
ncbi:heavy-metal-associated domain-containing protein [Aquibium sp. A9E412]|uniref:heavy-metal-associated domain-containing protein n=1 Tax=Aquibium sp. A9E412 TaxID=2976767 RepID=UPI0025B1D62D|nr:heavy-metal-associated domain-containing protein [Aquibium sp. A9E412]MDN2566654.1 heavy-metal-associated domain-containing protein [Aquibium sp. A9E412]